MTPNDEILLAAKQGDKEAFLIIIEPLESKLYRTALGIVGTKRDADTFAPSRTLVIYSQEFGPGSPCAHDGPLIDEVSGGIKHVSPLCSKMTNWRHLLGRIPLRFASTIKAPKYGVKSNVNRGCLSRPLCYP